MRRLVRTLVALAPAVAVMAIAPPAQAATPTLFSDWTPEVLPVGGTAFASWDCPGDPNEDVAVDLDGPGGHDASGPIEMGENGGDGHFQLVLGGAEGFGGVETDVAGSYTFTMTCPSGGAPADTTVEVIEPTMTPTVSVRRDVGPDACEDDPAVTSVPLGMSPLYCADVVNPLAGEVDAAWIMVLDGDGVWVSAGGGGVAGIGPGEVYHQEGQEGSAPVEDLERQVFVVLRDGDTYAASSIAPLTVDVTPAIAVTVTSGLTPETSCPENGGTATRTVAKGTTVYFCYSAELLSDLLVGESDIDSDPYGSIASDLADELEGIGATLEHADPTARVIETTVVNTATWTSVETSEDAFDRALPDDYPVTATGAATVTVEAAAVPDGGAQPVAGSPSFTG